MSDKNTGACVMWNGDLCKSGEFTSRMKFANSKYAPKDNQLEMIKQIKYTEIDQIPDIDDPACHEWYEIGEEKYGRSMYCAMTNTRRPPTMGEFYQNSTVD